MLACVLEPLYFDKERFTIFKNNKHINSKRKNILMFFPILLWTSFFLICLLFDLTWWYFLFLMSGFLIEGGVKLSLCYLFRHTEKNLFYLQYV
jgi:hypothetical protein